MTQGVSTLKEALERMANAGPKSVMVLGDFILDRYIWGTCHRISPEGPVPVVQVQSETDCLGGAGNVVANLHGLGVNALPIGVLGRDLAADRVRAHLGEIGCPTDMLIEVSDRPTMEKTRIIAQSQQVVRVDREVIEPFRDEVYAYLWTRAEAALKVADVCVISDYGKGVCQPALLRRVIGLAQKRSVPVLVDPKNTDFSRYGGATCVTPNLQETSRVTSLGGTDDAAVEKAARVLRDAYQFENVLITRGADGMTLLAGNAVLHIAAEAREVYDVSGAGDTVIATLAAAVGSGLDYESAARLANAAAGIVVGKVGTVPISFAELHQVVQTNGIQRSHAKVMTLRDLQRRLSLWRSEGKRVVFTNGCFDLLHLGHVALLEQAADLGNVLVIGLNTDSSVRRLKGAGRPVNGEQDRAYVLAGLAVVDAVVLFDEDTPLKLIEAIRPDVLVKGADYRKEEVVGGSFVESYGGKVALVSLVEGYSTTELISRVNNSL